VATGVLDYIAPWTRGKQGVVVTNAGGVPKSDDYDLIELHDHGSPSLDGDSKYPWVLGTMFEQLHESMAKTLRWVIEHVEDDGLLILHLPYPKHRPSQLLDMVSMLLPDPWIVSSELWNNQTLLVLRPTRPNKEANLTFYINNRHEVGDTISLIPLLDLLHTEWPNCQTVVRNDGYKLLSGKATVNPQIPERADAVLHQWTHQTEYGDYYRRSDDFYFFPIRLAVQNGLLPPGQNPKPPVPKIDGELSPKVRERLFKRGGTEYVVIAPEANQSLRQWPKERWQHVVSWLLESGYKVVVVGRDKFEYEPKVWRNKFVNLCGVTTVLELAAVIRSAKLVVGVDSSPGHLAMGHGVRSVLLQGMTAGAPLWRYDLVRSVTRKNTECLNCYQKHEPGNLYIEGQQSVVYGCKPSTDTPCMREISVTSVIDALREEFGMPVEPPSLSICMMVKNEEAVIQDALRGAVIAADEVILLDTGSTDKTREIAEANEKVRYIEHDGVGFENGTICDFAAVRNAAFDHAKSKYVMWLDAGDRIESPEKLRAAVMAETADILHMNTVFGDAVYLRERVGPKGLVHFVDRVHETMEITALHSASAGCSIQHVPTKKVGREGSLERNIRLLKRMITENPKSARRFRWFYYVARDLKQSGKKTESLQYFYDCRDGDGFWEERAHSSVEIGRAYMEMKDYHNSMMAGFEALKICDGWRDPYYIIGDAYYWLGRPDKAIPWFQHCLMLPKPNTVLWLWEDLYSWLPQCQLSYCFEKLGILDKALFWAQEEIRGVPQDQHRRVIERIRAMEKRL